MQTKPDINTTSLPCLLADPADTLTDEGLHCVKRPSATKANRGVMNLARPEFVAHHVACDVGGA
jgi:hypothetical protein